MFNRKPTINPWELSHHFNAVTFIYDDRGYRTGCAQLWAESENELYAAIEVEGWEDKPARYRDITCIEYLNNEVVRQWTLE